MPPFYSRYGLLVEKADLAAHADHQSSVLLWVETSQAKQMYIVASSNDLNVSEQVEAWEAYFSDLVQYWLRQRELPNETCGYWRPILLGDDAESTAPTMTTTS